jgi:hypothetical protein
LPRPLVIRSVVQLATLSDVRAMIDKHLPTQLWSKPQWRYVGARPK